MKRFALAAVVLCLSSTSFAGEVQQAIKSRWLGAWVVTNVETYSDCGSMYTNNRINGNLVKSRGRHRFGNGELVKLDKVDAKRSRLDISMSISEPVLVGYQDGPFTLYREVGCRVELEVEIPREAVKSKDVAAIERAILKVVERHETESSARNSDSWNERERDPFPDDYEVTLHEHAIWKAEMNNEVVEAQLVLAHEETDRLTERMTTDPDYLEGFVHGVEKARSTDLRSCSTLVALDLDRPQKKDDDATPEQARNNRGFEDGKNLIYSLELIRRLPDCRVEVPEPLN